MNNRLAFTNDSLIRAAFKKELIRALEDSQQPSPQIRIIEELGLDHGSARIDIAVVNGEIHGYELKSDVDTLNRLPDQMKTYNSVLDLVTLVVGKTHLRDAIHLVPDWWGIIVAKIDLNNDVIFYNIRNAEDNIEQDNVSLARLLWREEALEILEEINEAVGLRSKPRNVIYEKLASTLDQKILREKVREALLISRPDWRFDGQPMLGGG